jgi:hypothetical protein
MEYVYITHYILIHRHILIYWYYTFQFFIHERDEDHYFRGANGFFAESDREVFASITKKQVGFFVFLLHQLMSKDLSFCFCFLG